MTLTLRRHGEFPAWKDEFLKPAACSTQSQTEWDLGPGSRNSDAIVLNAGHSSLKAHRARSWHLVDDV